jgi:multidrug efflux pump subunit AcrA (membrane-fusion protein)
MTVRRLVLLELVILAVVAGGYYYETRLARAPGRGTQTAEAKVLYHCPMHPSYTSDKPGDCPICGMKLVPIKKEGTAKRARGAGNVAEARPGIKGQAAIYLSPEKQQLIGVRTDVVTYTPLTKVIRAVGQVTADETRLSHVHTKVEGWVEKLHVNFTGMLVKKGQPLLSIYSPELVATQEEYLLALRAQKRLKQSPFSEVAGGGDSLLAASRRRLELWDVPDSEIRRIEKAGRPFKAITLHSPASGFVMEKNVIAGQKVDSATDLLVIADLREVWVEVEFYEQDVGLVRLGDQARLTVTSYPQRAWTGRIDYIYPSVDPQTRTLRARLRFPNPPAGGLLKPGMYAEVRIEKALGRWLAVPEEAVLDSGTRKIVFIARGRGHFEPREVKVGLQAEGRREILSGLKAGDRIVTSGNFLIDSESRLESALEPMAETKPVRVGEGAAKGKPQKPAAAGHAGHSMPGMPGM